MTAAATARSAAIMPSTVTQLPCSAGGSGCCACVVGCVVGAVDEDVVEVAATDGATTGD